MSIIDSFQHKVAFLQQEELGTILKKLSKTLNKQLLENTEPRTFSPSMIRMASFDLCYLLLRHRLWHHSALLAELAIDFVNSEYYLPHALATSLVESSLDVLHRYIPRESHWQQEAFEDLFLEHLLTCTLLADNEESLARDLGFGRNTIELLRGAIALSTEPEEQQVFQFAPELSSRLYKILQRILEEIESQPERMDLYRLKNHLQRSAFMRHEMLEESFLRKQMQILSACFPKGKSADQLAHTLGEPISESLLRILQRNGLLFGEPQRHPKPILYSLSAKGFEMTSLGFAYQHWSELGQKFALKTLPPVYQTSALQLLARNQPERFRSLLQQHAIDLSPQALKIAIEFFQDDKITLFTLFEKILNFGSHPWLRLEICKALPIIEAGEKMPIMLDKLLQEDPSPMVRKAARGARQRWDNARTRPAQPAS